MGNNANGRLGLGDKSLTHSSVPCLVETLVQYAVSKVSCGWTHSAATTGIIVYKKIVLDKGIVFTWGLGDFGALGHGDVLTKHVPTEIDIFKKSQAKIVAVSCGSKHTAFLSSNLHYNSQYR